MTTQFRSLADQMLSALAYVLDVSTGEFRVETGDHWVTAEVGDVSLSAFLDDQELCEEESLSGRRNRPLIRKVQAAVGRLWSALL